MPAAPDRIDVRISADRTVLVSLHEAAGIVAQIQLLPADAIEVATELLTHARHLKSRPHDRDEE